MKRLLLSFIFLIVAFSANAQCAMCRATVENNVNNGEIGVESGINSGILYLFAAPYLLAMIIGYFWYKNSKNAKPKIDIKAILNSK